jgi:hypothetical protein
MLFLYGCGASSLSLKEERKLRVFEEKYLDLSESNGSLGKTSR